MREVPREAYRAIEDIVGADYISDDAVFLDSYALEVMAELIRPGYSHFMPRRGRWCCRPRRKKSRR